MNFQFRNAVFAMYVPPFRLRLLLLPNLILCIVVLGCSILLFGCGSAPTPTSTPPETPLPDSVSQNSTLILWHTFDDERRDTLQALANDFHKTYPNLSVNLVYVGSRDDLTKQMTAGIALGTAPDLVLADRRQIAEFTAQDGLQSLDKLMDDPELGLSPQDRTDYLRGALQLGTFPLLDNRMYGFPFYQEAFVLFYNADLMKTLNLNRAPPTWDAFADNAKDATDLPTYGWAMRADAATFQAMLLSRGSALMTDAETRALFNERAGINSLKLVADMNDGGVAKLAPSDDKARQEFASGKAAFYMGWMSELPILKQAQKSSKTSFDIGVGIMPQLDPETPWLLTRGDLFAIPKTAENRTRDAWFFIQWITSPTQSARWVRGTDSLPLRLSALNFIAPDQSSSLYFDQIFKSFKTVPPHLAPEPTPPHMDTIDELVSGLWLAAVQPKADLANILDTLVARVNQILALQS